jgi:trimethylamine--corrinoid protein Co-methyltransferase
MLYLAEKMIRAACEDGFAVFRREDLQRIHAVALGLLRDVGCRIDHERMRELLQAAGGTVETGTGVVTFRPEVVERAIEKQRRPPAAPPETVTVRASVGGLTCHTYDFREQRVRPSTKRDLDEASVLGEVLEDVPTVGPLFIPQDVPARTSTVHAAQVMVTRTLKARSFEIFSACAVKPVKEILSAAAGGWEPAKARYQPTYYAFISSPLFFCREALEIGLAALDEGYDVRWGAPMVIAGATAPQTFAGAIAQSTAEALVALMCAEATGQAWSPGMGPVTNDPRTGTVQYSGPDRSILALAASDVSHFYGRGQGGHLGFTDALTPGCQAGFEKAYGMLLQVMAFGWGGTCAGLLGPGGNAGSIEQILIDVEWASALERLFADVPVDEESLAVDLIRQVGIGGSYLAEEHTVAHFRNVLWFPALLRRTMTEEPGKADQVVTAAHEKARSLLAANDPHVLSEDQERQIAEIVRRADRELQA